MPYVVLLGTMGGMTQTAMTWTHQTSAAARLRAARAAAEYSREEAAGALGVSSKTLERYEKEPEPLEKPKRGPGLDFFERAAALYGVSVESLAWGKLGGYLTLYKKRANGVRSDADQLELFEARTDLDGEGTSWEMRPSSVDIRTDSESEDCRETRSPSTGTPTERSHDGSLVAA